MEKYLLENEERERSGKWVIAFPAKMLVESIVGNGRDKFRDDKMFVEKLEEKGDFINESVLRVGKKYLLMKSCGI